MSKNKKTPFFYLAFLFILIGVVYIIINAQSINDYIAQYVEAGYEKADVISSTWKSFIPVILDPIGYFIGTGFVLLGIDSILTRDSGCLKIKEEKSVEVSKEEKPGKKTTKKVVTETTDKEEKSVKKTAKKSKKKDSSEKESEEEKNNTEEK